jgi:hypothetical protein
MSEGYKRCPDCAEQVLAAARKCRYCGYRFDRGASAGAARGGGSMLELLFRPKSTATLPDLLMEWGTELAPGEQVSYFGYCRVESNYGFLLITSTRVGFFAGRGENRLIEWPREQVRARKEGRRALRLIGPDREVVLTRLESRSALAAVAAQLAGG